MAVTLDNVRAWLDSDEPNYKAASQLGSSILPHLKTLIASGDERYASKAAYLATLIDDERAVDILKQAASSPSSLVRIAVAGGLNKIKRPADAGIIMSLMNDRDPGVRKFAIKAAGASGNSALIAKLDTLSRNDPSPHLRTLASNAASEARGRRTA
jgi:HEAT repeat protein